MPSPVSQKQYRYLKAIMEGRAGHSARGDRVPKSVAEKYDLSRDSKELPESKHKEHHGGVWTSAHHHKHSKKLQKAFSDHYAGQGTGAIIVNSEGKILIGKGNDGKWQLPGGHVEPGEDFEAAMLREVQEETGLIPTKWYALHRSKEEGNDSQSFVVTLFEGKLGTKTDKELSELKFIQAVDVPDNMRTCSANSLREFLKTKLNKSLSTMAAIEILEKNILRSGVGSDVVYEMRHADAMSLVGNSTFKWLKSIVKDMSDEDFREVGFDNYKIHIRKHANDVYSGRIVDGHKMIHQWTNRSLPMMTADLMSVFEWYQPGDEEFLNNLTDDIDDEVLGGGLQALMDNYKKHNISNIYDEMHSIRSDIRNGVAVDLQQVEQRIMKLFDKLENVVHTVTGQHNKLCEQAGDEMDIVHQKLAALQSQLDSIGLKPTKVEAYSASPINPNEVYSNGYMFLPKPKVTIDPSGRITIEFGPNWTPMERENFLTDMRAKALKKSKSKK